MSRNEVLVGRRAVGVELIDKTCWRCRRQLFTVSGVITTEPDCSGWDRARWRSGEWQLIDFYALYQFDDKAAEHVADAVSALAREFSDWLKASSKQFARIEKRLIKKAGSVLWTSVCSTCSSTDGPSILIETERPGLVQAWRKNVQEQKLIYRGIVVEFGTPLRTYEDIKAGHQIAHYLEGR